MKATNTSRRPTCAAPGRRACWPRARRSRRGGRRVAERRKADYLYELAVAARGVVRNQVELEVEDAYLEYQEMAERLPVGRRAMENAAAAMKSLRDEQILGIEPEDYPRHFDN